MSESGAGGATSNDQSFQNKSFQKKNTKKADKKKVLPTNKKFPELKLMISGEGRNSNQTFSSDDENLNVLLLNSLNLCIDVISTN